MSEVEDLMRPFLLDNAVYRQIGDLLLQEMEKGLDATTNAEAKVKMFPTYVRSLPNGSERGHFLALDLGGTNFRVLLITLDGKEVNMENKIYPVPEHVMTGHGTKLFDHIAECIADFMQAHNLNDQRLPLGFTFSFPCKQEGLAVGRLVTWTKGFTCEGVEGEDVVQMLHEAIIRRGDIDVDCVALLNDTVGCLMSCAFKDHNSEIGVILGTGSNACYMEKLERVGTWNGDNNEPKQVIINTEWGAFGDNGCLDFMRTQVDKDIDESSLNRGKQIYEKMISGMYMGEIVRRVVVQGVEQGLLFGGRSSAELLEPGRFYTKYVSEVEVDEPGSSYENTKKVLEELNIDDVSTDDCRHIHSICTGISSRAAFLASTGIATLLNRINKPNITVGVDGSLYRYHPKFEALMRQKISELLRPGNKFEMLLSHDGSGKGAALVAAVAFRMQSEQNA